MTENLNKQVSVTPTPGALFYLRFYSGANTPAMKDHFNALIKTLNNILSTFVCYFVGLKFLFVY